MKNIRSMSMQLLRLLMLAGICSISFLTVVLVCSDLIINRHFSSSGLQLQMTEKRVESFGDYISKNNVSATDTDKLIKWCDKQPMLLMEIYRDNILYFNSSYSYDDPLIDQNIEIPRYSWYSYYELQFADGPAEVLVYSDESYILNTWITIGAIILSGVLFITVILIEIRKTIRYIYLLCDEIQIMGSGDLEHPVTVRGQNDRCTDKKHLEKYLARIHEKGLQMKEISDHLLKYSLSQGMPEALIMQSTSFQSAFFDRLSELIDYLTEHGFAVECDIDWIETQIRYNDLYLNRILDNIASNINKYAEKNIR